MSAATPDMPRTRAGLAAWIESAVFQRFIIILIIVNAVILGLETDPRMMASWGAALRMLDQVILAVFVVEILLRISVYRWAFFRDPWSLFDLAVVAIALVPASGPLAVLRALRVLRVFRLIGAVPSMRRVVSGLLGALPGLGAVFAVMVLIFYVSSVIATHLFGSQFPDWFGHLGASAYTLFQVMTLESWSMGIARPVLEQMPWAWVFFIIFILVATFTLLNLFIAVIVSALQSEHELEPDLRPVSAALEVEFQALRGELVALRALIEQQARSAAASGAARDGDAASST